MIAGPPASGKTTLGAALARALHHVFLDLDIVTGPLTRTALALAGADETALDGPLGARLRDARYGALLDTGAANLDLGLGVVVSGPFTRERTDHERWEALRGRLRCPEATLVCLELDDQVRHARMAARGAPRDRAKLSAPGETAEPAPGETAEPAPGETAEPAPVADAIRLDADAPPEALLDAALVALSARDAGNLLRPQPEQPSPPFRMAPSAAPIPRSPC